ncbi:hypothetical protein ACOTVE_09165, partial [Campylobacter jejuni]|uniref:hypothetical protein n=1 Tax=Campylobacter jejuni TaxID=197 RepID=UPI003BA00C02
LVLKDYYQDEYLVIVAFSTNVETKKIELVGYVNASDVLIEVFRGETSDDDKQILLNESVGWNNSEHQILVQKIVIDMYATLWLVENNEAVSEKVSINRKAIKKIRNKIRNKATDKRTVRIGSSYTEYSFSKKSLNALPKFYHVPYWTRRGHWRRTATGNRIWIKQQIVRPKNVRNEVKNTHREYKL